MATAKVNGLTLGYEVIGDGAGRPWSITPGGRFTKESPGVRQFAEVLAGQGHRVLIWDRPNCGESDVCFEGSSESAMQADALVALLEHLDMTPAVISGGSGGARVSLLAASRHPEAAAGVAVWWISGGVYGLLSLATHYCGGSLGEAWRDGMGAVAALPEWAEVIERNSSNRQRFLDQDRDEFIRTMERWMVAYCPATGSTSPACRTPTPAHGHPRPGVPERRERPAPHPGDLGGAGLDAAAVPAGRATLGDREWIERQVARDEGLFARWPLLAPQLLEWQAETLG